MAWVAVLITDVDSRALILKRSQNVGRHKGYWNLPAGEVDAGESAAEAAIRELREETGLIVADVEFLREGPHDGTFFRACLMGEPNQVEINWEHTDYRWIESNSIVRLASLSKYGEHMTRYQLMSESGGEPEPVVHSHGRLIHDFFIDGGKKS